MGIDPTDEIAPHHCGPDGPPCRLVGTGPNEAARSNPCFQMTQPSHPTTGAYTAIPPTTAVGPSTDRTPSIKPNAATAPKNDSPHKQEMPYTNSIEYGRGLWVLFGFHGSGSGAVIVLLDSCTDDLSGSGT